MKKKTTQFLVFSLLAMAARADVAVPFWQQSFNAGFPTAWSTDDASGQGVKWMQCDNIQLCPPAIFANYFCSDPEFRSPGFDDGYMFVNSFEHGALPSPSQSYLRTEAIDCTNKLAVFISFYTYIHAVYGNPDMNAVLRVKSGNGAWEEFTIFPNLNYTTSESLQSWNVQPVQLDISSAAANKPDVTIEWRWTANFDVAWMIDDVALFDENPLYENVVWGQTAGEGDFNGGQNGWTVINYPLDICKWVWVDSANIDLPDSGVKADALACWTGIENGAMLINASFCQAGNLPTPYSHSDLKSPAIDLSGIASGTHLDLKFNQAMALGNLASTVLAVASVAVSVNNGISFIDTIEVSPLSQFRRGSCNEARIRLPEEVAGKPQVRLQFIFSGDSDYWMVDDVRIATANDHDVSLNPAFFNVAPDYGVPGNQVREISLFAQVRNFGNQPLTGVAVFADVKNGENQVVFRDTVEVGTLQPDENWTDVFFPKKYLPSSHQDDLTCFYRVASNEPDQDLTNNKAHWRYHVTDTVFSKNEFCSTSMGYFLPTESVAYEIGNCYYIPKGSKLKATSMSFAFKNVTLLANNNAQLSIKLYQWKKGANQGDANVDTLANDDEYEQLAFNTYEVTGEENNQVVTVPISYEAPSIDLEDGTYYFVTVGYLEPVYQNGEALPFPIGGSEVVNYTAMFYHSYLDGVPAYVSMLREGDDTYFRANAWALRRIPFVNLNVEQLPSADFTPQQTGKIALSPNPTSDFVRLTADFPATQQPTQVEIFDLCGRSVLTQSFEGGIVSQLPIAVGELRNGSYTLRVISGGRIFSGKLIIVH